MNTLDELFKEKLTDHAVVPSPGSWEKVEAGLSKKNDTVIWIRWAAAFLVGALLLGSLWLQKSDGPQVVTEKKSSIQETSPAIHKSVPPTLAEHKKGSTVARKRKVIVPPSQSSVQTPSLMKETAQVLEEQSLQATPAEETQAIEIAKTQKVVSPSIVLTYTLGPIGAPAEEESEALASDRKDNSLKRMVDFAKNVKNGDSPIGGLRVMKEDLFALDLKKKTTSKNH